ncbi:MAG: GIY-YIG nuclease family protein [Alphaproteobacteria bacterium]
MASVYILYSKIADKYYIGSTKELKTRIEYHHNKEFKNSFTSKYNDWELFYSINEVSNTTARKIESHIKRMKSIIYMENLKKYPEISPKLVQKYTIQ